MTPSVTKKAEVSQASPKDKPANESRPHPLLALGIVIAIVCIITAFTGCDENHREEVLTPAVIDPPARPPAHPEKLLTYADSFEDAPVRFPAAGCRLVVMLVSLNTKVDNATKIIYHPSYITIVSKEEDGQTKVYDYAGVFLAYDSPVGAKTRPATLPAAPASAE